jgi:hypothetical protein
VDTQHEWGNQEEINKLRLEKAELKKELKREQLLHNLLYKEWKELHDQVNAKEQEVFYEKKPKNLFYKYGFYILLIGLLPIVYFLYPFTGVQKIISSSPVPMNSSKDSISNTNSTVTKDSLPVAQPVSTVKEKEPASQPAAEQPPPAQAITRVAEKVKLSSDSTGARNQAIRKKAMPERPLTDDIRDSIASEGFNAYFDHRRNPFRRTSERYKIWAQGWTSGKAEAAKVVAKDPSLKDR